MTIITVHKMMITLTNISHAFALSTKCKESGSVETVFAQNISAIINSKLTSLVTANFHNT